MPASGPKPGSASGTAVAPAGTRSAALRVDTRRGLPVGSEARDRVLEERASMERSRGLVAAHARALAARENSERPAASRSQPRDVDADAPWLVDVAEGPDHAVDGASDHVVQELLQRELPAVDHGPGRRNARHCPPRCRRPCEELDASVTVRLLLARRRRRSGSPGLCSIWRGVVVVRLGSLRARPA